MKTVVVGLGVQGAKRIRVAGDEVVATVDPTVAGTRFKTVQEVPLDSFDAALLCTPDQVKLDLLDYLLSRGKHVLVEKPLLAPHGDQISQLAEIADAAGATCYTAYNHRFEPQIARLKQVLDAGTLGEIYTARLFYGNGTAADVRSSPWRDTGLGVLHDLGSHLLDLVLFLFGHRDREFDIWRVNQFETRCFDHVIFGSRDRPSIQMEVTLLSWRNTFSIDIIGELGSAHVAGLCKWGPSTLTVRRRVLPSGVPHEEVESIECPDPTWELEYVYFKGLCETGGTNIANDLWINSALSQLNQCATVGQIR